jgi:hypothetical protein
MPGQTTTKRPRNRVFESLHKPLTCLGVERTLFYFVCVGAVGAFNLFNSILAGVAVFIGGNHLLQMTYLQAVSRTRLEITLLRHGCHKD